MAPIPAAWMRSTARYSLTRRRPVIETRWTRASSTCMPDRAAGELGVGAKHSCAIRGDGTLWCWGANDAGQLGTGSFVESHVPVASLLSCP